MTPSQLSAQLYHIAAKISNSKSPRRDLVARDLQLLINKISVDISNNPEIPDREPDQISKNGTKIWKLDDDRELRINDVGTIFWVKNGKFHREDGPAIIHPDGTKDWYKNGKPHREDGPAVEKPNGSKEWFQNGQRHREDGPAIEDFDGTKYWFLNGKRIGKGEQPENWDELVSNLSQSGVKT